MTLTAFAGASVFTGEQLLDGQIVLIDGKRFVGYVPEKEVDPSIERVELAGGILSPGFIDIQVNGGGGVLLNDQPTVAGIASICRAHVQFGTTYLLPTVITDSEEVISAAIDAAGRAVEDRVPGCGGIHVEGPFIAFARKGAHNAQFVRKLSEAELDRLCSSHVRPMLVTVATESVSLEQIAKLKAAGITVSIGHCDGQFEDVQGAIAAGASCITHLFNAMSQMGHRAPGVVGAALDSSEVWASIIADGHHVHPAMLDLALRSKKGRNRMIAISDAMPTVGSEGHQFDLGGRIATRENGRLTLEDGTLAGCDISLHDAVCYLIKTMGLPTDEALRMATTNPAAMLGLKDRGRIEQGARADMVWLQPDLSIGQVWVGGKAVS